MWSLFARFSRIDRTREDELVPIVGAALPKALGAIGLMVLSLVGLIICVLLAWTSGSSVPVARHYLVPPHQKPVPVWTAQQPGLSTKRVQSWATYAMQDIMHFNFNNMQERELENRMYFTDLGWDAFKDAIKGSTLSKEVVAKQLEVWAVPIKEGRVTQAMTYGDAMVWEVQIPTLIIYRGPSQSVVKRMMATMQLRQVPSSESVDGIAIVKISFQNYR